MNSEHQVSRGKFFLIFLIIIFQTLSLSIWKGNCGSRALNSPIYFVFGLPKVSLIMLQYENTDFAFSQNKNSVVYVNYIQLKQDVMFFITAKDFFLEYNLNAFSFRESITWACNSFVAIALYIYIYYSSIPTLYYQSFSQIKYSCSLGRYLRFPK